MRSRPLPLAPRLLLLTGTASLLIGCASRSAVMELSGSLMYEKPAIASVSHTIADARDRGGQAVVTITVVGDPGLAASFDITPGVANRTPMTEVGEGRYVGTYAFASDAVGGPYVVLGRLRHDAAGEVVGRDPDPIILSVVER